MGEVIKTQMVHSFPPTNRQFSGKCEKRGGVGEGERL